MAGHLIMELTSNDVKPAPMSLGPRGAGAGRHVAEAC